MVPAVGRLTQRENLPASSIVRNIRTTEQPVKRLPCSPLGSLVRLLRTMEKVSRGHILQPMRPLYHPSVEDITVEGILHALSDPVRVAILADIVGSACSHTCSNFLRVSERDIPKSTLSQHFKALREAGLIHGERRGVEMHNTARCQDLEKRFPGLVEAIVKAYQVQMSEKQRTASGKRKTSSRSATAR
jgi:DNA-binding transcriptional ArsR family regulator